MSLVDLVAADGHRFQAYSAGPRGARRGGLVVIQEIFGVNGHIRAVADGFAADGFEVLAPAVFDRVERNVELGYAEEDTKKGRALRAQLGWDAPMLDIGACVAALAPRGPVATIGYCWGGSLSWLAAAQLPVARSVCYYGGQIKEWIASVPKVPVMMHFGETDTLIPMTDVEAIRAAHPEVKVHVYPVGHGFNCDHRASYDAMAAQQARARTVTFLQEQQL